HAGGIIGPPPPPSKARPSPPMPARAIAKSGRYRLHPVFGPPPAFSRLMAMLSLEALFPLERVQRDASRAAAVLGPMALADAAGLLGWATGSSIFRNSKWEIPRIRGGRVVLVDKQVEGASRFRIHLGPAQLRASRCQE